MKTRQNPAQLLTNIAIRKDNGSAQTGGAKQSKWTEPFFPKTEPNQKLSRRLHRKEAAPYLGSSLSWLDKARLSGNGPVFISIGGRIVYDTADLDAFLEQNRHRSTSEYK